MATYRVLCENCKREFTAHRRDQRFCSNNCRQAYWRRSHGIGSVGYVMAEGGPAPSRDKPVDERQIADAIVRLRAIAGELSAGEVTGPPAYRPLCSRVKSDILSALDREGL